jgi:hypothetical protein
MALAIAPTSRRSSAPLFDPLPQPAPSSAVAESAVHHALVACGNAFGRMPELEADNDRRVLLLVADVMRACAEALFRETGNPDEVDIRLSELARRRP